MVILSNHPKIEQNAKRSFCDPKIIQKAEWQIFTKHDTFFSAANLLLFAANFFFTTPALRQKKYPVSGTGRRKIDHPACPI